MKQRPLTSFNSSRNTRFALTGLLCIFGICSSIGGTVMNANDSGPGSLRQAIADAAPNETIDFHSSLSGGSIILSSGVLHIQSSLTIDASSLSGLFGVSGNRTQQVFGVGPNTTVIMRGFAILFGKGAWGGGINNSGDLTLDHMYLLANTSANVGGGIRHYDGKLTLNHTTIQGNSAPEGGGIHIENNSTAPDSVTLNNSTVSGNSATGKGGGIFQNTGTTLVINHSTLNGNSATTSGGAVYTHDLVTLNNSTVADNASTFGGGIYNAQTGTLTLNNSTIADNAASDTGGGIRNLLGTLNSINSIIAGNTAPTDANIGGPMTSSLNSLTSGDPLLIALGDYGGPTQTMPPRPGSPAIDEGNTSSTNSLTDQRGSPRVVGASVDMGAVEGTPPVFYPVVTSNADTGAGSLRQIIADALPGSVITFTNTLDAQTIVFTSGQITLNKSLHINASALPNGIILDGHGHVTSNRIFEIANSTNVFDNLTLTNGIWYDDQGGGAIYLTAGCLTLTNCTLSSNTAQGEYDYGFNGGGAIYNDEGILTITHSSLSNNTVRGADEHFNPGYSEGGGGAIYNDGGMLTITHSMLSDNSISYSDGREDFNRGYGDGGGIYNKDGTLTISHSTLKENSTYSSYGNGGAIYIDRGDLAIDNTTLSDNSANYDGDGGGIYNDGTLTLHHSTLSGNSADENGGGIYSEYSLRLNQSTLSGNSATYRGGGIYIYSASLYATNCIIAGNTANSGDPNLRLDYDFRGSNNLTNGIPQLAPLGNYGGTTQTMPPLAGSPAIDSGLTSATNSLMDQRGMPRILSSGFNPPIVDIGAVEFSQWLLGQDVSTVDLSQLDLSGALYDDTTLFPDGFDADAAGMLHVMTPSNKDDLVAAGEANVTQNPVAYGLYTESAFQVLALDRPFLSADPNTGKFTLTVGVLQASDLSSTFTTLTGFTTTSTPETGIIDLEFDAPSPDAHFFQLYGTTPAP